MSLEVSLSFESPNGLFGLMRDLVLRLCDLIVKQPGTDIKVKDDSIRTVIGACQEFHAWRTHLYFKCSRLRFINIPVLFRPNSMENITHTPNDSLHLSRTLFLEIQITSGVFQWKVQISYAEKSLSLFNFGAAPSNRLVECDNDHLGCMSGGCSLLFLKDHTGRLQTGLQGVMNEIKCQSFEKEKIRVPDNASVTEELDTRTSTLSFLVNGKKIRHAISGLPTPIHLGMFLYQGSNSFTSLSFGRISSVTPYPADCCMHPYCPLYEFVETGGGRSDDEADDDDDDNDEAASEMDDVGDNDDERMS